VHDPAALPATSFAYVQKDDTYHHRIVIADLATQTSHDFGPSGGEVTGLAIAPDRKHIAYTDGLAVYLIGVDGSNLHQISQPITAPGGEYVQLDEPEFSPDGGTLLVGFGLWSSSSSGAGGTSPATLAVTGGAVNRVQAALDSNCQIVTGMRFLPDGSAIAAIHSTCIDETKAGVFLHSPQTGAGTLYYTNKDLVLTKPVITGNVGIVVGPGGNGYNGLLVVQSGALTNTFQAPTGLSFDDIAISADGVTLLIGAHDIQSFNKNIYATTDFQTYTPITTTNNAVMPVF
jgi:Tol biopolymer transport system component